MDKNYFIASAIVIIALATTARAQSDRVDPNLDNPNPRLSNPNPNLGSPNPHLDDPNPNLNSAQPGSGGSNVNPTMKPDNAQPFGNPNVGQGVMNGPNNVTTPQNVSGAAAVDNNWRMVNHNGRWWYWTPDNAWLYRNGNGWMAYKGRGTARRNLAERNLYNQQRRVGYRGAARFNAEAQGTNDPLIGDRSTLNGRASVRGGANFTEGTATFNGTRPPLPTALELQRFQSQQQNLNMPYGGTMGGARNQTAPVGGGATRTNTFGTSPSALGSPGNPNAVPQSTPGSPGNPRAVPQTAPGNTGNTAEFGGASPTGGVGTAPGASGVGGTGSTTGGTAGASGSGG